MNHAAAGRDKKSPGARNHRRAGAEMRIIMKRKAWGAAALALILGAAAQPACTQEAKTRLFKVVTPKDDIVIGLDDGELSALGGRDAGAVAHALAQKGDLTVWQYSVRRGAGGDLQQAPSARIGLIAHTALRVEPYSTPYTIVPHE